MNRFSESFVNTNLGSLISREPKSIISGPFGSNIGKRFFQDKGIPVIRGNNLSTNTIKFIDSGFVFITKEKADELNCYAVTNDIIFTAVGTIGQVGIIEDRLLYDEYIISNKQIRVRFDTEKILPLYAYYWFSSKWMQNIISQRNVGSTVPLLNLSIIRGLPIKLPRSIVTQRNIVRILENVTSKIELNNRIKAELEAMAKTLYDYWFVQFDFPVLNNDGSLSGVEGYKTSGGKMVWNEELKRKIPEGWKVQPLSNIANITTGKLDSNAEVVGAKYPFYTCASEPSTTDTFAFDDTVILIAGNNAAGNFHINRHKGKFNAYQRTYIVTAKKPTELEYLYQVLKTETKSLKSQGKGSQTKFLTIGMLTSIKTFVNTGLMELYNGIVNPIYEQQVIIRSQNQQLSELRDWLLPMLMNGQVTVGDNVNSSDDSKSSDELTPDKLTSYESGY